MSAFGSKRRSALYQRQVRLFWSLLANRSQWSQSVDLYFGTRHADEILHLRRLRSQSGLWDLRSKFLHSEDGKRDILSTTLWTVQVISKHPSPEATYPPFNSVGTQENSHRHTEGWSYETNCAQQLNSAPTSAKYLPRRPWRRPWHSFLDPARSSLIRGVDKSSQRFEEMGLCIEKWIDRWEFCLQVPMNG
ncbi:hypothetical protein BT96DRAFT_1020368 [Gymnopus androsaceus JB14]|uniref:Uncharacterized protein n=1 Tax=Gymnopus androsaceus JB14 TaxID=1447944 RepID=A0A6A4HLV8_9AGAR|nr:hypothetical protein BT96DRAFT_1020368 [Gymnopus androsaceus JB14]